MDDKGVTVRRRLHLDLSNESVGAMVWRELVRRYSAGELNRLEVAEAIRQGYTIPQEAVELVAGIIDGTGRPLRDGRPGAGTPIQKRLAVQMVDVVRREILSPSKNAPPEALPELRRMHRLATTVRRTRVTALEQAKRWVAAHHGVSVRTLETWTREVRAETAGMLRQK